MGLQRVARENGGGFTERLVACWPASAEIVIVERRQIVVDQGIRVKHLQRCAEFVHAIGKRSGDQPRRFHAQDRAQTLPARKNTVPHGAMNDRGVLSFRWEKALQSGVGGSASAFEYLLEHAPV